MRQRENGKTQSLKVTTKNWRLEGRWRKTWASVKWRKTTKGQQPKSTPTSRKGSGSNWLPEGNPLASIPTKLHGLTSKLMSPRGAVTQDDIDGAVGGSIEFPLIEEGKTEENLKLGQVEELPAPIGIKGRKSVGCEWFEDRIAVAMDNDRVESPLKDSLSGDDREKTKLIDPKNDERKMDIGKAGFAAVAPWEPVGVQFNEMEFIDIKMENDEEDA